MAGILKQSMGARNRVGIGLLYRPARLHTAWRNLVSWAPQLVFYTATLFSTLSRVRGSETVELICGGMGYTYRVKAGDHKEMSSNSAENVIDGTNGIWLFPTEFRLFPRNRKLTEFRSEPFRGKENNPEFRSVEQK